MMFWRRQLMRVEAPLYSYWSRREEEWEVILNSSSSKATGTGQEKEYAEEEDGGLMIAIIVS